MSSQDEPTALGADAEPQSLAELFHLIRSLVPEQQEVIRVSPRARVADALALMQAHDYSQLPVVAGDTVLGVFSYRSLATRLLAMGPTKEPIGNLPVDEFMEQAAFAHPSENWESALDHLNRRDAVLVGNSDRLEGILTAMDVLSYLRDVANPFVMLAEIELSLRRIIRGCATGAELRDCIKDSLASKYAPDEVPTILTELTLNDYIQIVCHGRNWPRFAEAFGEGEWQRQLTAANLREVRELRNEVFHFRRRLDAADRATLSRHREWLQMKTQSFEALKRQAEAPSTPPSTPRTRQWDEQSYMQKLEEDKGSAAVQSARRILEWARGKGIEVWWGRGRVYGSFVPLLHHKGRTHQLLAAYTSGTVEVYFQSYKAKPPFQPEEKRRELLEKFNAVKGIYFPDDAITRRPSVLLSALEDEAMLQGFLEVFDWIVEEIQSS